MNIKIAVVAILIFISIFAGSFIVKNNSFIKKGQKQITEETKDVIYNLSVIKIVFIC